MIVGENGTYFTVRAAEWRNDCELFAELDRTFASTPAIQLDGEWAPEQRGEVSGRDLTDSNA